MLTRLVFGVENVATATAELSAVSVVQVKVFVVVCASGGVESFEAGDSVRGY